MVADAVPPPLIDTSDMGRLTTPVTSMTGIGGSSAGPRSVPRTWLLRPAPEDGLAEAELMPP